ncbi:MAG: hypothetical protein M0Z71_12080 [Nitrospiraceae bacterium]|nr:hypothetical protein [Nitrospiraceae bacterium]
MDGRLNRLYFTVNLREGDLESLIASLNRLRRAEILAEKHGIKTESELEDYERIVTLLAPTAKLAPLSDELKKMCIEPGTLDVYDPAALSVAEKLGFVVEDLTSEN